MCMYVSYCFPVKHNNNETRNEIRKSKRLSNARSVVYNDDENDEDDDDNALVTAVSAKHGTSFL